MIPRLKPWLDRAELRALFHGAGGAVTRFEAEFAQTMTARHAIAFPYGRSALWAFLKAIGLEDAEVILPAYTCVVVAHAIVLSNNRPRFVDITLSDYNMDLAQAAAAINERTRAIIATHLWGYPLDVDQLGEIVCAAEQRYGHKIWVIQDCAHAFGAKWQGRFVANEGDVALFGLNISKMITTIFGGMLTTNDPDLAERLRSWRDEYFNHPGRLKTWRRRLYLAAVYPAFNEQMYGLVNWLQTETPLLNYLTKSYHLDEKIHFPPDYLDQMLALEAQVGRVQLTKYPEIIRRRQQMARFYDEQLRNSPAWVLPPLIEDATYSHYAVRVANRQLWLTAAGRAGVELGQLIEYSIPEMPPYQPYAAGEEFPNARLAMHSMLNLPIHPQMTEAARQHIVDVMQATAVQSTLSWTGV